MATGERSSSVADVPDEACAAEFATGCLPAAAVTGEDVPFTGRAVVAVAACAPVAAVTGDDAPFAGRTAAPVAACAPASEAADEAPFAECVVAAPEGARAVEVTSDCVAEPDTALFTVEAIVPVEVAASRTSVTACVAGAADDEVLVVGRAGIAPEAVRAVTSAAACSSEAERPVATATD